MPLIVEFEDGMKDKLFEKYPVRAPEDVSWLEFGYHRVTDHIIASMIGAQVGWKITEENVAEWYFRYMMMNLAQDSTWGIHPETKKRVPYRQLRFEEWRDHIGMSVNVGDTDFPEWFNNTIVRRLHSEARNYVEKNMPHVPELPETSIQYIPISGSDMRTIANALNPGMLRYFVNEIKGVSPDWYELRHRWRLFEENLDYARYQIDQIIKDRNLESNMFATEVSHWRNGSPFYQQKVDLDKHLIGITEDNWQEWVVREVMTAIPKRDHLLEKVDQYELNTFDEINHHNQIGAHPEDGYEQRGEAEWINHHLMGIMVEETNAFIRDHNPDGDWTYYSPAFHDPFNNDRLGFMAHVINPGIIAKWTQRFESKDVSDRFIVEFQEWADEAIRLRHKLTTYMRQQGIELQYVGETVEQFMGIDEEDDV